MFTNIFWTVFDHKNNMYEFECLFNASLVCVYVLQTHQCVTRWRAADRP